MVKDDYIKYQTSALADSLIGSIGINFQSISFNIIENGFIQVLIVLKYQSNIDDELIEDIMCEFCARQENDCVLKPIIKIGNSFNPFPYLVFKLRDSF
jgi:hypothetical protein